MRALCYTCTIDMRIFEFSFNPKVDGSSVRKLLYKQERLFLLGEIERPLPRNRKLLDELFHIAESRYRSKASLKQQVKEILKNINSFLAQQQKQGNVDWLGRLHCLLLFSGPGKRSFPLYAASVGTVHAFLLRNAKLVEIRQKKEKETRVISSHFFQSFVSGTLIAGDRLFLFTKELGPALLKQKLLWQISSFEKEGDFHSFFRQKRTHVAKASGLLTVLQVPALQDGSSPSSPLLTQNLSIPRPSIAINVTKNQLLFILLLTLLGVGFVLFRLL